MKKFNPKLEKLKLKVKQNKDKIIKTSTLFICLIGLIVGIMYFSHAKYTTSHSWTIVNAKVGEFSKGDVGIIGYVIDGVSSNTAATCPPTTA